jgi:hypothetical protein
MTKLTQQQSEDVAKLIGAAVNLLNARLVKLEAEREARGKLVMDQAEMINELRKELAAAKKSPPVVTWAKIAEDKSKRTSEHVSLLNVVANENKDRDKKEKNIIIFGLEESKKETVVAKKEDDMVKLNAIFNVMQVDAPEIDNVFRINGKDTNKAKPLILVLKSVKERNKILKCTRKLKDSEYKDVFLSPDLTEAQRAGFKKLVEERNQKNAENTDQEYIFVIRDDRVVKQKRKF